MTEVSLIVHGHFYQPPRENPWTEELPREPGAAPYHDWNERIAAESYRPNAFADILDEEGRVVSIINNYEHLSWDFGPTLLSWLATHEPETYERLAEADRSTAGGMGQAFFHIILPLADSADVRTQVRWGLREFAHRFGRRPAGIWLPETAVDDAVLGILAEEGVQFTLLAPGQARAVRPLGADDDAWTEVEHSTLDTRQAYRWQHPADPTKGLDLLFCDGGMSHAVAFELSSLTSEALVDRVVSAGDGGAVTIATDGETFGHHHKFGDRLLAYAFARVAPDRGLAVTTPEAWLAANPPSDEAVVRQSSWSCAHGIERWRSDCGCSTGGQAGWNQAWRGPLRLALDVVSGAVAGAFERRAPRCLHNPTAARDAYVDVLIGRVTRAEFEAAHVIGDAVEAMTLLEAERHRMAMYTSCGWFFNDLAGLETVQVLRYAGRALDCIRELGEKVPDDEFLNRLSEAHSNVAEEGSGRDIWFRHVLSVRVDPARVVAQLALGELLDGRSPESPVAAYDVEVQHHERTARGSLALTSGVAAVAHRRTGRCTELAYAALHFGGLDVLGATRPADHERDLDDLRAVREAFGAGAPVTTMLRLIGDHFGPSEFGVGSALPGEVERILGRPAGSLTLDD
ncbi:MAG: DUF3536 domain-containing protein [Acidimicrobiales bacterium]